MFHALHRFLQNLAYLGHTSNGTNDLQSIKIKQYFQERQYTNGFLGHISTPIDFNMGNVR